MPTQEGILTVILVAIVANLAVALGLLVGPRIRRRRDRNALTDLDTRVFVRAQAFGGSDGSSEPSADRFDREGPGVEPTQMTASADPAIESSAPAATQDGGDGDPGDVSTADPATGFDGPATWSKRLTEEDARVRRYGRAATIVLVELAGVDRLAELLGPAAAERLIPPIATTMQKHARSADSLARLGPTRFAALLPDTDEVRAINYVERVRSACDIWLEAGAVSLRLSMGWAEISTNQPVDAAIVAAERRLNVQRQRLRSRDAGDLEDDHDVVAAQMRPARAN
jgi:diguanylate cyclase (GGDEF)-like protein